MSMSRSPHKSRERIVTLAPPHFCEAKPLPFYPSARGRARTARKQHIYAVVETPRGSRAKFEFDLCSLQIRRASGACRM
jgi:hypothetical protein